MHFPFPRFVRQRAGGAITPTLVDTGTYHGLTPPLSELPVLTEEEFRQQMMESYVPNEEEKKEKSYPFSEAALPKGPDPVQDTPGTQKSGTDDIQLTFAGTTSPYQVSDCNGAAGPDHYMLTLNSFYTVYDKEGNTVAGPTNMNLLFGSVPGANCNDGDPTGTWHQCSFDVADMPDC